MSYRYEGVLRKPGLLPGRKTKVWCILDDKELIFYRENRRHSCIGSEELSDIKSIHRLEGTDSRDFQINTETKTTVYTAEDAESCEKWVSHIKEALRALGLQHSDEEVKSPDKPALKIPKSPEKSVHSLMQLWQQGPKNKPESSSRNTEKPKVQHISLACGQQFGGFAPSKVKSKADAVDIVKEGVVTAKESKVVSSSPVNIVGEEIKEKLKRTDSGYETIVSDKRDSDHKSDSEAKESSEPESKTQKNTGAAETPNGSLLSQNDSKRDSKTKETHDQVIKDEQIQEDRKLSNGKRDSKTKETHDQVIKDQQIEEDSKISNGSHLVENISNDIEDKAQEDETDSRSKELVNVETREGVEEVDISNVVLRRKSRPSASLLLETEGVSMEIQKAPEDVFSTKDIIINDEDINANEKLPDPARTESKQESQRSSASQAEEKLNSTAATVEETAVDDENVNSNENSSRLSTTSEEEQPVVLRRDSKPAVTMSSAPETVDSPPILEAHEESDDVDGADEGDFNVDNFEDFLNELNFDPLPETSPLKLDDISESILEISDIIQGEGGRKSLRKSKFKCENPEDMISELKTLINNN